MLTIFRYLALSLGLVAASLGIYAELGRRELVEIKQAYVLTTLWEPGDGRTGTNSFIVPGGIRHLSSSPPGYYIAAVSTASSRDPHLLCLENRPITLSIQVNGKPVIPESRWFPHFASASCSKPVFFYAANPGDTFSAAYSLPEDSSMIKSVILKPWVPAEKDVIVGMAIREQFAGLRFWFGLAAVICTGIFFLLQREHS